jgi:anti-sigma regulatory factor (Ser/Thr protein kinase)
MPQRRTLCFAKEWDTHGVVGGRTKQNARLGHPAYLEVTWLPPSGRLSTMDANLKQTTFDIFDAANEDAQRRQSIQNIVDSYHHDYDVLAELCQNAVDAIREKDPPKGQINVRFDRKNHSIEVSDSGVGMTREKVEKALAPGATSKKGQAKLIGEKGLGLTFCAFRANKITIETSRGDGYVHMVAFEGGRDWVEERRAAKPMAVVSSRQEAREPFTKVTAQDVAADFTVEDQRLSHLLRTKTALGSTYPLWTELEKRNAGCDIKLSIIETDGTEKSTTLPHCYWHPADHLLHKKSLEDVRELARNNKMRDFKGWGLTDKRSVLIANRSAYFYTLMLSIPEYDKLAEQQGLLGRYKLRQKEAERTGTEIPRADEPGDVEPGIYLSVRGMPTGISLPFPTGTTEAGYWNNFYFLVEAEWLSFDAGRKVVPGRTQEVIKRACKAIWDDMRAWKTSFIGHEGEDSVDQFAEQQKVQTRLEKIKEYPDLPLGKIPFAKVPQTEQATIAVFHEILGRNLLKGYQTWDINTASTYDAVVKYSLPGSEAGAQALQIWRDRLNKKTQSIEVFPLNVEYKFEAATILDDFGDKAKYLEQIDLIVCWSCDDHRFEKAGVAVHTVERDAELFNGASKRLEFGAAFSTQRNVYVIELKGLIQRLESEG